MPDASDVFSKFLPEDLAFVLPIGSVLYWVSARKPCGHIGTTNVTQYCVKVLGGQFFSVQKLTIAATFVAAFVALFGRGLRRVSSQPAKSKPPG